MPGNVPLKRVHQHFNLHTVFLSLALSLSLSLSLQSCSFTFFFTLRDLESTILFLEYFVLIYHFFFFLQCLCPRTLIAKVLRADTFHIMKLLTYIFYSAKWICPGKPWVGKFAPRMYQEQHMWHRWTMINSF